MSLYESNFLISNSEEMLQTIEDFYSKSLREKEISIVLQLKIKHFLEDIKSALDYAAFYIYKRYSKEFITAKPEDHERSVCFPVHFSEKRFNTVMENIFINLNQANNEIIETFKSVQPFVKSESWYTIFNQLVNKNKHRYLTPQTKNQTTYINNLKAGPIEMVGCTVVGPSLNVSVDGNVFNLIDEKPNGLVEHIDAVTWVDFQFTELNLSVIPTLREILHESTSLIKKLEVLIEKP
ncbi:hypothetical protein MOF32_27015 [Priestia megaterium]|uniref:hypothetical protein n=1 Tax=Priestia megaterium TaxID=1404 RepID=UPI002280D038|nr:hypothetical protein [Priestia megaterium]MCY9026537.1 hypothetical protein [Priestia megaterium]